MIQAIIKKGGDVNAVNNNGVSGLGMACQIGQIKTINVLIKCGADINVTDADGNTYLHNAVREDYSKEVMQAIISQGANVNATVRYIIAFYLVIVFVDSICHNALVIFFPHCWTCR